MKKEVDKINELIIIKEWNIMNGDVISKLKDYKRAVQENFFAFLYFFDILLVFFYFLQTCYDIFFSILSFYIFFFFRQFSVFIFCSLTLNNSLLFS